MKRINVQNESNVNARGTHLRGNSKPVFNITTGEVYVSLSDAAERLGISKGTLSMAVTGKNKTCQGMRFCYVSKLTEHIEEISESINKKNAVYNEITSWQRANERVAQHKARIEKLQQKLEDEMKLLEAAESEVKNYKVNNNWLM